MSEYSRRLGVAFQIADDVLDYRGEAARWARASATIWLKAS